MTSGILAYYAYGPGPHVEQVKYSVWSAVAMSPADAPPRVVIYTDDPTRYADLPAEFELLTPAELDEWQGPMKYHFRRKMFIIERALRTYNVPVFLMDGDTFFLKPPEVVLQRIRPGKSVMHIRETRIDNMPQFHRKVADALNRSPTPGPDGQPLPNFTGQMWMWNAGLLGVHPAQVDLIPLVVHVNDQIWEKCQSGHAEQVAWAYVLQEKTHLQRCDDVIFHYWKPYLRKPFTAKLPELLADTATLPPRERAAALYRQRIRLPLKRKLIASTRNTLHRLGITRWGVSSSG